MGPTILLDKSALQSLSVKEIDVLARHYTILVPLILVLEILGDLKSKEKDVSILANKLRLQSVKINSWHRSLTIADLLGESIPLYGQPVLDGVILKTKEGESFRFADNPESEAILNWREGNFSEAEKELSQRWKDQTSNIDLETFKTNHTYQKKFRNLKEIQDTVTCNLRENYSSLSFQKELLEIYLSEVSLDSLNRRKIMQRWRRNPKTFQKFAPYSYYCFYANQIFKLGIINGFVSTSRKSKSRIDLEYFYYLPFAQIFCSNDKFHKDLWEYITPRGKDFISGTDLKEDLAKIADEFNALDSESQKNRLKEYGSYPSSQQDSFTVKIWEKMIKAGKIRPRNKVAGNQVDNLSDEDRQAILAQLRPYQDAIYEFKP